MKRNIALFPIVAALFCSSNSFAQSADERIATAMNNSDWFELYELYYSTPKDSITPFLEVFSRCLIGNRLNRPDISIQAFGELLNNPSGSLDLGNVISSAQMMAMDLSRIGENLQAANVINSIVEATKEHLDSANTENLLDFARQYSALSQYKPYTITFDAGNRGAIPFSLKPVGPTEKESILIQLENSSVNGIPAKITFDTGAGVNVISDSLAARYGLIPLDAGIDVMGLGKTKSRMAIAKTLRIGNITVEDVPFHVINLTANNEEADKYIKALEFVVGSELMLQLKDVTIDFSRNEITVPTKAPARSEAKPNLCFSSTMNFLAQGSVSGQPVLFIVDSGDSGYGKLNADFYHSNKELLETTCESDTVRQAGVGGVWSVKCYKLKNAPLAIGEANATIPLIDVTTENHGTTETWCCLGVKSLMLFSKVRFNLVDFTFAATPY